MSGTTNDSEDASSSEPAAIRAELFGTDPVAQGALNADLFERMFGEPSPDLLETLGRYEILRQLGEGGMGVVYLARDPELDRNVAVKVLSRTRKLSGHARERLIREAKSLAKLAHPNVVTVFDVGLHDDKVYIAMEYVDGQTIRRWLQVRPRTWAEVLEVFIGVGDGLATMHEQGLVHRDFKPDNVLVEASGRAQLIDFGLARRMDLTADDESDGDLSPTGARSSAEDPSQADGDGDLARLTRTGMVMGTAAYMSPEQIGGQPITAASDQFSLCVSLFEATYGCPPFEGDTYHARAWSVLHESVVTPPTRASAPLELFDVLCRGLRRAPEDRWPDMGELLRVLRSLRASYNPDVDDPNRLRQRRRFMVCLAMFTALTAFLLSALAITGAMALRPSRLVVSSTVLFAVVLTAAGVLRPRWKGYAESRRMFWLLVTLMGSYLVNNLVGWAADRSVYHTLLGNMTILATMLAFSALLILRGLAWASLLTLVGLCAMLVDPSHFFVYFNCTHASVVPLVMRYLPQRPVQRWIRIAANQSGTESRPSKGSGG